MGDGTTTQRDTPVQVSGLSGVLAVAAGAEAWHSHAMKSDGTVWAWGANGAGELGDGTTTQRDTPVQVSGLSGVLAVAAGFFHSLALKLDGTVWACGDNEAGELGDGTTTTRDTPVQVSGMQASVIPLLTVTSLADSGPGSLRTAIAAASPGATITFASCLAGSITLTGGGLVINTDLTITGPGPKTLTVNGNHNDLVFHIASGNVNLSGLTIYNGLASVGGGVYNQGTVTLSNCTVTANDSDGFGGGGLWNDGTMNIYNCTVCSRRCRVSRWRGGRDLQQCGPHDDDHQLDDLRQLRNQLWRRRRHLQRRTADREQLHHCQQQCDRDGW